jgi:hypothetical protein
LERIRLNSDWIELLEAFNAAGVRYLVVGAFALGRLATPRATGDLDLWVDREPENARKLFDSLVAFGAPLQGLTAADFSTEDFVFTMGRPPLGIDIMTSASGISFAQAWATCEEGRLGNVPVRFIGRDAFLLNKRAAGRMKDLADIEAVENVDKKRDSRADTL